MYTYICTADLIPPGVCSLGPWILQVARLQMAVLSCLRLATALKRLLQCRSITDAYQMYYVAPNRYSQALAYPGLRTVPSRTTSACPQSSTRVASRICRTKIIIVRVKVL